MVMSLKQKLERQKKPPKQKPCPPGSHEEVIENPEVPPDEEDPQARLAAKRAAGDDPHEIRAAERNVREGHITHGNQISRGRTPAERDAGKKGDEQFIWAVCVICGARREIDEGSNDGVTESKDRARNAGQDDQYDNNAKLQKDGIPVTYKVPESQATGGRGRAIRDAFRDRSARTPTITGIPRA